MFDPALHDVIKAQPWQHARFLSKVVMPMINSSPEDDGGGVGPVPGAPSPRDEAASDPTSDEEDGGAGGASEYSPSTPEHDLDLDQLLPDDTLLQAFVPAAGCADSSVRAENASASVADARPSATVREAPLLKVTWNDHLRCHELQTAATRLQGSTQSTLLQVHTTMRASAPTSMTTILICSKTTTML
eukprot:s1782_g19.t1